MMLAFNDQESGRGPDQNVAPFVVREKYLLYLAAAELRQQMAEELLKLESGHLIEEDSFNLQADLAE
jgi:hypothetical protein